MFPKTPSLPRPESAVGSAVFSHSISPNSLDSSASERRYVSHSRPASVAPPVDAGDATEKPHADGDGRYDGSNRSDSEFTSHTSEDGSLAEGSSAAHSAHDSDRRSSRCSGRGRLASSATSPSLSTSLDDHAASASTASSSADASAYQPASGLSAAQMEEALQLYVGRGGVHAHEVPALLRALDWCRLGTVPAPAASTPLVENDGTASPLLDPEAWLATVALAAAVPSKQQKEEQDSEEAIITAAVAVPTHRYSPEDSAVYHPHLHFSPQQSSVRSAAAATALTLGASRPAPEEGTAEHRRPSASFSATAATEPCLDTSGSPVPPSSSHDMASSRRDTDRHASASSSSASVSSPPTQQLDGGKKTPTAAHDIHRKLAYEDGDDAEAAGNATCQADEPQPPPPQFQQREQEAAAADTDASTQCVKASLSLPYLNTLAEAPPSMPLQPPPPHIPPNDSNRRSASARPPRSAPPPPSQNPSNATALPEMSLSQRLQAPSKSAPGVAKSTSSSSLPPSAAGGLSATSRAALAEAAGMRTLFLLCLSLPTDRGNGNDVDACAVTEKDWILLVEQLRRDGHHKLPPQPIVEDVARTMAQATQEKHSLHNANGLSLKDFTQILHRQLDEVRRDLMPPLLPQAQQPSRPSSSSLSSPSSVPFLGANTRFSVIPNYLLHASTATAATTTAAGTAGVRASIPSLTSVSGGALANSSNRNSGALTETADRRVLPTWCMALAGLFPLEMSTVCPVPVVRYLRSVALMNAVLEALVQRLQLEVEAVSSQVESVAMLRTTASPSQDGTQQRRQNSQSGIGAPTRATAFSPANSTEQALHAYVWPPPQSSSATRLSSAQQLPLDAAAAAASRPPSSVALSRSSAFQENGVWHEHSEWHAAVDATASRYETDDGAPLPHRRDDHPGDEGPHSVASPAVAKAQPRYLEPKPLDAIGASVAARAKARRLMDSLRRNTVPINRYECFARVENDDEPVQQSLCFISEAELKETLDLKAGTGEDGADSASDDLDAMSDLIGTLTHDPAVEEAKAKARAAAAAPLYINRLRSADARLAGVRPPLLPRMSVARMVPAVFGGAPRVSVVRRSYASLVDGDSNTGVTDGPRNGLAASQSVSPPRRATLSVPQPTPGMFRMTGMLFDRLPRKQEAALVDRLSRPLFDPRLMGLRSASATLRQSAPVAMSHPAAASAAPPSSRVQSAGPLRLYTSHDVQSGGLMGSDAGLGRHSPVPREPSRDDLPDFTQASLVLCSSSPSNASSHRHQDAPQHSHELAQIHDGAQGLVVVSGGGVVSMPSREMPPSATATCATSAHHRTVRTATHLTDEQSREFHYFQVPLVLAADPFSTAAAATAVTQVMTGTPTALVAPPSKETARRRPRPVPLRPLCQRQPKPPRRPTPCNAVPSPSPGSGAERRAKARAVAVGPPAVATGASRAHKAPPLYSASQSFEPRHERRQPFHVKRAKKARAARRNHDSAASSATSATGPAETQAPPSALTHDTTAGDSLMLSTTTTCSENEDRGDEEAGDDGAEEEDRETEHTQLPISAAVATALGKRSSTRPEPRSPPRRQLVPPARMSLYKRRLLHQLQRTYVAEHALAG